MDTKVVTAHVPLLLADKIDELAERMERSPGWIVQQALTAWIDVQEERHALTLAAMEDVDTGRVISHRDVLAWAESLDKKSKLPVPR